VPGDVRGSCEPYQIQGTDVAVVCSTSDSAGPLRVVYAQYTPALVDSTFMEMTQGLEIVPSSSCGSGACDYSSNSTNDSGRDVWYQTTSSTGSPVMGVAWTSNNTGILAYAEQQASNNSALEAWWASSSSGPM
jgi:hypothetical protein